MLSKDSWQIFEEHALINMLNGFLKELKTNPLFEL